MYTIVVNSQKGGCGKSMLVKHLSAEAERCGDGPVYVIDTDPQGAPALWHKKGASERPGHLDVEFMRLDAGLEIIRKKGAAFCIIDSGAGRLEDSSDLFKLADFIVVLVQPSEDDLDAIPATMERVKAARILVPCRRRVMWAIADQSPR